MYKYVSFIQRFTSIYSIPYTDFVCRISVRSFSFLKTLTYFFVQFTYFCSIHESNSHIRYFQPLNTFLVEQSILKLKRSETKITASNHQLARPMSVLPPSLTSQCFFDEPLPMRISDTAPCVYSNCMAMRTAQYKINFHDLV